MLININSYPDLIEGKKPDLIWFDGGYYMAVVDRGDSVALYRWDGIADVWIERDTFDKVEYVQEEVDVLDKCIWCGKSYGEHLDRRGLNDPVPRVPCTLLKSGFRSKQKDLS